ncbi:PilZ domain-containing protein [Methylobacterium sp. NMS14P]|uniref:PilZ domain-containing protein n=1 Tax=Methylobacterium sp. NMS14P TaxID=2894310 RepID=UPI00235A15B5|nr:PilZ domain-containing protein [Methylobacterium sp. NMS14P]WCS25186.1 PilZ domain-containing protein [Methylobacterium sp. NMS14P]
MSRNASPPAAFVERRATERKSTALLAFAQHRDGARYPCQVKNISDRGAMLEFLGSQAVLLEDVFDLVLASAEMRYAVQLVWRKERTVGVLFCGDAV